MKFIHRIAENIDLSKQLFTIAHDPSSKEAAKLLTALSGFNSNTPASRDDIEAVKLRATRTVSLFAHWYSSWVTAFILLSVPVIIVLTIAMMLGLSDITTMAMISLITLAFEAVVFSIAVRKNPSLIESFNPHIEETIEKLFQPASDEKCLQLKTFSYQVLDKKLQPYNRLLREQNPPRRHYLYEFYLWRNIFLYEARLIYPNTYETKFAVQTFGVHH